MNITEDLLYIGVNDDDIDLFEGQYPVSKGMSYNSYIVCDEKVAVLDTVDKAFGDEWFSNIQNILQGREPDYLFVHHMEPDHSANIGKFMDKYKSAKIVSNQKSFAMINQFFGNDYKDRQIIVGEGDKLSLGKHEFTFITAPMVHWPEVTLSYDNVSKTVFSADAFGKFGKFDADEIWDDEARRYYFGIVGKYGVQVQNLLKKLSAFEIERICPLHGPVLDNNLNYYLNLYNIWSSYEAEEKGVVIAYTSIYGNTKKAVLLLEEELKKEGCEKVVVLDLARCPVSEAVEKAFKYDRLVLGTTTYNGGIFPFMEQFLNHLTERNYQNRKVGIIENGTWALMAEKTIKQFLEKSKNITYTDTTVHIKSAVTDKNIEEIYSLAKELCN